MRRYSFLFLICSVIFAGAVFANITIPNQLQQGVQYIKTMIFTTDGMQESTPVVEINSGGKALIVHTTDQNGIWIVPGSFRDGSIMKPDLGFDIIEKPITCAEGSGFVYAIDKNGEGKCRLIGPNDVTAEFSGAYQARIQGPCPQDTFISQILVDGTTICTSPTSGYINSLITEQTVINRGSGYFQEDITGVCPVGSVVLNVNDTGSLVCVNILDILSQGVMCAQGYSLQGFSGSAMVCKPTSPIQTCIGGTVTIGFNSSGGMICGLPTMTVCKPGSFFVGGTGSYLGVQGCKSLASLGTCAPSEWMQGRNTDGTPICKKVNHICTSGQIAVSLSGTVLGCQPVGLPNRSCGTSGRVAGINQCGVSCESGTPSITCGWDTSARSACSSPTLVCGTGSQTRTATCKRTDGTVIADSFCLAIAPKPALSQSCNLGTCSSGGTGSTGGTGGGGPIIPPPGPIIPPPSGGGCSTCGCPGVTVGPNGGYCS